MVNDTMAVWQLFFGKYLGQVDSLFESLFEKEYTSISYIDAIV